MDGWRRRAHRWGPDRITCARNVFLLAVLFVALAWVLGPSRQRTDALLADGRWLIDVANRRVAWLHTIERLAPVVAGSAAVGVFLVAVIEGAWVVGGSDSYGYVSQAHLWSIGQLRQEPVLHGPLAGDVSLDVLTPLGYRPSRDGTTIAPTYSPGLPVVMAIFERVTGPDSVFWVVPILAGTLHRFSSNSRPRR